jgi:hypothetical protein
MFHGRKSTQQLTLLILASVVLAGCPTREEQFGRRLVGRWHGTVRVNAKKLEPTLTGVDGKVQLETLVDALEALQLTLVFHASGSVEVTTSTVDGKLPEETGRGTWKVLSADEHSMELEMLLQDPLEQGEENRQLRTVQFAGEDRFRITTGPPGAEDAIVQHYQRQVVRE